jgi:hypothetical protein
LSNFFAGTPAEAMKGSFRRADRRFHPYQGIG